MRIAVNTRLLLPDRMEGMGWFSHETLKRIVRKHPEHEFIFFFDRAWDRQFIYAENVIPHRLFPPTRHPLLWYTWFEWVIPKALKRTHADLFYSPDGYLSLRTSVPQVGVLHDLNFIHRPGDLPFLTRHYYRYFFRKFAEKAERIITVSEHSKQDIISNYQVPGKRIDVVYNGAQEIYRPLSNEVREAVRQEITGGKPYFVFIGSIHPRKNVDRLLAAFDIFRAQHGREFKLLIVGSPMFRTGEVKNRLKQMQYREDVHFTGRLEPEALHRVLGSATALAFVSLFEGFGIPVVEALYCDVPVLTSKAASLPEVAGDAALLVDPLDVNAIAGGMKKLAEEPGLRKTLIEKGRVQRKKFSWDQTAEGVWDSLHQVIESRGMKSKN